jgi:hypothetical protein
VYEAVTELFEEDWFVQWMEGVDAGGEELAEEKGKKRY